ncbi:MAG: dihydroflavonol-4-reductase [Maribacter sp.]|jgi:dihydroflavonol-4-reductase
MKVLITGANGLLGSNLTRKLLQKGFEVKAMVRESSNLLSLKNSGAELFKGNLDNLSHLRKALSGCQAVVHTAANTSQWPTNQDYYKKINVEFTRLLLEESLASGVERFVFVSSANAFGPGTIENPGNELSPFTQLQSQSGYMWSKHEAQELVLDFAKKHQFHAVVVNPTFMLGKYDAKPSSGQILFMAYGKSRMLCPPSGKNFVHVEDVATGIISAIERGKTGNCYLLANENLSYRDFFIRMKFVCGYPKKLIHVPKPVLAMTGQMGSLYEKVTGKPSKLNHINGQLLLTDNYYSPTKAIRELQLPQTPIEQAIEDALGWFTEFGYLY